jgi:hypothetical protein
LWNYFLNKVVTRQTINAGWCASGGLGPSDKIDQEQSRTNSATSGELLPELKHVKQLALDYTSTGIFSGKSQELDLTLFSLNTL